MIDARIICYRLIDDDFIEVIGGVQKYIQNVAQIMVSKGYRTTVYQYATNNTFRNNIDGYYVVSDSKIKSVNDILSYIDKENPNYNEDILFFASDYFVRKSKFKKVITVQHGIAWDITQDAKASDFKNYLCALKSPFRSIKKFNKYKYCSCIVCVDYNFLNWYRTQVLNVSDKFIVIPNYTVVPDKIAKKTNKKVSIVYSRRFEEYRGTRLFSKAIEKILSLYPNISVTIAGSGPDEKWMKEELKEYNQITFTSYKARDSLEFHTSFDIAVVPTKGSEGTSLSLLEAMAAGCAVIATNVGGMTQIVIDGYNGLMISPYMDELFLAIEKLINEPMYRQQLANKGYETVREGFSYDRWRGRWETLLDKLQSEKHT